MRYPFSLRSLSLAGAVAASLAAAPCFAQDVTREITLTDDLRPNPIRIEGQIAAPVKVKDLGIRLDKGFDQCRYIEYAEVPRVPQVVLVLPKPKQVGIVKVPYNYQNPGALLVYEDGRHFCIDGISQLKKLNLLAGRWQVFMLPRSLSKKYAFKIYDLTRNDTVLDPPPGTPTLAVDAGFKPNPLVHRVELGESGNVVRDYVLDGWLRCGDEAKVSEKPSFVLDLRQEHGQSPITIRSSHDYVVFDTVKGKWFCVGGRGTKVPLSMGKHLLYAVRSYRLERPSGTSAWLAVDDSARPVQYVIAPTASNTTTLAAKLDKPVTLSGTATALRIPNPLLRDRCKVLPETPDFYLRTSAPLKDARLQLLGGTEQLRVVGPLEDDGRMKLDRRASNRAQASARRCFQGTRPGDAARREGVHEMALDGLYAVYVGGAEGTEPRAYHLRVFQKKTTLEPLARAAEPPADLALERRVLAAWYPDLHLRYQLTPDYFERVHKLFLEAPRGLVVFAKPAAENTRVKAGTPLLVRRYGKRVKALTPNGRSVELEADEVAVAPPGPVVGPEPVELQLSESDLQKFLGEDALESFLARQKKFNDCYRRVMDKLDPDGNAGRYDIVTYRRGRILKVEGLAARNRRIAGKRCGEKAYDRYVAKLTKKTAAEHAERHEKRIEEIRARIAGLAK